MTQHIDKAALVAEIERRVNNLYPKNGQGMVVTKILKDHYEDLKDFLDTLEVKEVEESTAADRGMAEKIIINLKRVEQDYHIDLTNEMEWIRNKSRKGE